MADSSPKRPFLAVPKVASVPELADAQKRQLPSTRIPLKINLRPAYKSKLKFQLPFVPQNQPEYPSDARCVLRVWELDRYKRLVSGVLGSESENDKSVGSGGEDNELLGEIQGFVKQLNKWEFIFLADQNPEASSDQSDQTTQRITLRIPRLLQNGAINVDDWVLNVTGEIETRLEIGISICEASKKLDDKTDFKTKEFPYPVVHLHKISQPPTPDEFLSVWKEKWNIWKKGGRTHIGCDVAARQVCEVMGGKWSNTTVWRRPSAAKGSKKSWYRCTWLEGDEALKRIEKGFGDRIVINRKSDNSIESVVCRVFKGKPYEDENGKKRCEFDDLNDYPLNPGMLIYTAELWLKWPCDDKDCFNCKTETGPGWRWHSNHFVMYHDNDQVLDSVNLAEPEPGPLGPVWVEEESKIFVVLRIHDPFSSIR